MIPHIHDMNIHHDMHKITTKHIISMHISHITIHTYMLIFSYICMYIDCVYAKVTLIVYMYGMYVIHTYVHVCCK